MRVGEGDIFFIQERYESFRLFFNFVKNYNFYFMRAFVCYLFFSFLSIVIFPTNNLVFGINLICKYEFNNDSIFSSKSINDSLNSKIFQVVDEMPVFLAANGSLFGYIADSLRRPIVDIDINKLPKLICTFVVDCSGNVRNVKVLRPVHPLLDAEAVRLLRSLPQWQAGKQNGEFVNVAMTIYLSFAQKNDPQTVKSVDIPSIQTENPSADKIIYRVVDKMPEFWGGSEELINFLSLNTIYPPDAMRKRISGRVICSFVVGVDGKISDIVVLKSVHPSLDAEAVRVIKSMPNWKPGLMDGKPINVKYTLPVNFRLP